MRKRIKGGLVVRATPTYVVRISELPKKPYVKVFGVWKSIKESELSIYKGFQIKWE